MEAAAGRLGRACGAELERKEAERTAGDAELAGEAWQEPPWASS